MSKLFISVLSLLASRSLTRLKKNAFWYAHVCTCFKRWSSSGIYWTCFFCTSSHYNYVSNQLFLDCLLWCVVSENWAITHLTETWAVGKHCHCVLSVLIRGGLSQYCENLHCCLLSSQGILLKTFEVENSILSLFLTCLENVQTLLPENLPVVKCY